MADNGIMDVTPHASVDEFFHDVVQEALDAIHLATNEPTEWYLVGLLGEFTRGRITDEPLGLQLADAPAEPGQRVKRLKEVGDTSLYVSGFFAESLGRKLVDIEYYASIGSAAYAELASRLGGSLTEVYGELAARFPDFVEVLAEVRRRVDFAGTDIVRLYQQWLRTRDEWIERKLRAFGVLVDPGKVIQ
jgi:hypothetical protein